MIAWQIQRKLDQWVLDHFDGDDLQYFLRTTDKGSLVFFIKNMFRIETKTYKKY